MLLLLSMILAVLPLLGIAALIYVNPELTVDNLFMSLILLTVSGIFGINVLLELRDRGLPLPLLGKKREPGMVAVSAGRAYVVMSTGGGIRKPRGKAFRDVPDDRQVVRDQQHAHAQIARQLHQRPHPESGAAFGAYGGVRFRECRTGNIQMGPGEIGHELLQD